MWKWSNLTNIFQMGWNHQPEKSKGRYCVDPGLKFWLLGIQGFFKTETSNMCDRVDQLTWNFHIIGDKLINPIVGVYILIIRIPYLRLEVSHPQGPRSWSTLADHYSWHLDRLFSLALEPKIGTRLVPSSFASRRSPTSTWVTETTGGESRFVFLCSWWSNALESVASISGKLPRCNAIKLVLGRCNPKSQWWFMMTSCLIPAEYS